MTSYIPHKHNLLQKFSCDRIYRVLVAFLRDDHQHLRPESDQGEPNEPLNVYLRRPAQHPTRVDDTEKNHTHVMGPTS